MSVETQCSKYWVDIQVAANAMKDLVFMEHVRAQLDRKADRHLERESLRLGDRYLRGDCAQEVIGPVADDRGFRRIVRIYKVVRAATQ